MKRLLFPLLILSALKLFSQTDPKWDDVNSKDWPEECEQISIPSSVDGKEQAAFFYKSESKAPRPLIISLHTWSGGYEQRDTLSWICIDRDYHYIHPDFRGPNTTYEACGSPLALSDIEDAIDYALQNANVDTNRIHIIGASGGGYATLLAYMNTRHRISSFSAWVPISNLVDWYYESEGRKSKYSWHIAMATTGKSFKKDQYYFNEPEAIKRSPIYMRTPVENRLNSKLYIHAGVHDGYTGSVPITHTLNFYNKVVADFDILDKDALIPSGEITNLLTYRGSSNPNRGSIGGRDIHLQKNYKDKVRVTIFEGGHEMLTDVAMKQVEGKSILCIGDSNGEYILGWVHQLQQLRFEDKIFNTCLSGNTIGFNNLGDPRKNTLLNYDRNLRESYDAIGTLDAIVIMLGTNDCKAVFADSLKYVPRNMRTLIRQIKAHEVYGKSKPQIYVVSPPPVGPEDILIAKYKGSTERIEYLQSEFRKVAEKEDCIFVDCYTPLKKVIEHLSADGIHLMPEGQKIIAKIIDEKIRDTSAVPR